MSYLFNELFIYLTKQQMNNPNNVPCPKNINSCVSKANKNTGLWELCGSIVVTRQEHRSHMWLLITSVHHRCHLTPARNICKALPISLFWVPRNSTNYQKNVPQPDWQIVNGFSNRAVTVSLGRGGRGGTTHMNGVGMVVVSLRVFWAKRHHIKPWRSRLGLHAKKYKNIYLIYIFLIRFIYSIHIIQVFSFVCVLTWSLLGVKKSLGHAQIGLLKTSDEDPHPFHMRSPLLRVLCIPRVIMALVHTQILAHWWGLITGFGTGSQT